MCHIILVENSITIVHFTSHRQSESGLSKEQTHLLNRILNLRHLLFNVVYLVVLVTVSFRGRLDLALEALSRDSLLSFAHCLQLLVMLDLVRDLLVRHLDHIDVRVQHIDVVVQRVVLFLCLYESCNDFLH